MSKRRILILRPRNRCQETANRIESMGAIALQLPMQGFVNLELQSVVDTPFDIGICLSRAAAESAGGQSLLPKIAKHWLAIGPATARILKDNDTTAQVPAGGNYTSEDLLDLPQLKTVKGVRIALLTGDDGRDILEKTLKQRGAEVQKFLLYQRIPIDYPDKTDMKKNLTQSDAVLLTSAESTRLLAGHLEQNNLSAASLGTAFALSERIGHVATKLGFNCASVQWQADLGDLYNHLQTWIEQQPNP